MLNYVLENPVYKCCFHSRVLFILLLIFICCSACSAFYISFRGQKKINKIKFGIFLWPKSMDTITFFSPADFFQCADNVTQYETKSVASQVIRKTKMSDNTNQKHAFCLSGSVSVVLLFFSGRGLNKLQESVGLKSFSCSITKKVF